MKFYDEKGKEVRIYKVRLWVIDSKPTDGAFHKAIENRELTVIGNLNYKTAEDTYIEWRDIYRLILAQPDFNMIGFVEFFEAHVDSEGRIHSYPIDDGEFISRESNVKEEK